MANRTFKWTVHRVCKLIERMLSNKFDCNVIIEGNRGLGKSTLAYLICNGVKNINVVHPDGRLEPMKINFTPKRDILYSRSEIIKAFNERWFSSFMADEMINVSFNRDFYNENQKRLIKIMNMNRDHCNLFVACVPQFQTIDNQVKNLCKIKLTVVRRGLCIVQTQNRTLYNPDRWDTDINEKIERGWFKGGVHKPKYAQLTTFRGVMRFRDLTARERAEYEEIKLQKRNEIKELENKEFDQGNPNDKLYALLNEGKIRTREMFNNMCFILGLKPLNAIQNIRIRMRNDNNQASINEYFVDDQKKFEDLET